ncbi:hypothetical protein HNP00_004258 [Arthrobacter sp. AZCC_0090]|nr:hypothetical protein [Arthrobacter sp. AZCC_0090]
MPVLSGAMSENPRDSYSGWKLDLGRELAGLGYSAHL